VFPGLAPARRRLVLGLLGLTVAAVVALGAVLVLSPATGHSRDQVAQERPGPVLLVPGYGGGGTVPLQMLADRLTAAGRDATVVALPDGGTGDLNASADALDVAVAAALERTGEETVDVVGYSAGGVIARLWVAGGGGDVARRVVTLGSPHHGTTLADLVGDVTADQCPVGCQQLTTGSELLAGLNASDETPDGPTWVSIWTTQDQTVTPPDSARLEGALNISVQSVCAAERVGHGDLPRNPLVQQAVLAELAAGSPVELGPADCTRLGG
jgi:triacylglycerol esterase/lipase EstA (alpha/beta hydrolase family)